MGAVNAFLDRLVADGTFLGGKQGAFPRFRQGGETLRQRHARSLKNLCQESGLPAWLRPRLPLIYKDEELVAIAAVPGWGFPMQIADGYAVNGSEAGFDLALHLNDRL